MIKVNNEEIQFETFPNGETRMLAENLLELIDKNSNLVVDFKYESDSDLIKLMFVRKYIKRYHSGNTHLNIRYMPYSRMDRSENDSPFTLKYISEFINDLGFHSISVGEPHSDVTCALLEYAEPECINENLLTIVMNDIQFDLEFDYVVYPDAGAQKRYAKIFDGNILVGHKHRDFETGQIKELELIGNINNHGTKAVIVDDLSSYGGTFVRTAIELKKLGIEEIYLLVAHAENSIFKGELFDHMTKVYTTDTILSEQNHWQNKKFENQLHIFEIEGVDKLS